MNRSRIIAVTTALSKKLLAEGSWCGETHLQKAVYFLQELLQVPTGFEFLLYKHGPFSFDLRDELMAMRAEGYLELRVREEPYGPTLMATKRSARLRERYPKTLKQFTRQVDFVGGRLGDKGASELERLATALYVTREHPDHSPRQRSKRLQQLKPKVSDYQAETAVAFVDGLLSEAKQLSLA